ncbi:ATP phosphoribosyltransferase regulatory subunit [Fictibacillus terranigra]|uniref:ATP phosphoribosyltransferase regulatory subunit n=1 Tax=Fictibacillus terranigra TaxID=3058424 RepID=A0ABT8E2J4_9BACL|nr:ATP phosphoribosyltransferase regulatory subunit [Fictibacillus sp. CENA-BCM004]MDN4072126.1 ATP phosphoribosyltransferase regulatory subunit [Fictibacillus sp. CENA-BCM004]
MSKPFVFEKPMGMRDTLPLLYQVKQQVRQVMEQEIKGWGYQFIQTPTLEYYDTVGEASAILDQQLFKLLDSEGKTLVLRPDMTAPIARVVSSSMKNVSYPIRLAYDSAVFRSQQREGGRPAEFEQVGVELIGDGTSSADAEVIALMVSALSKAGLDEFKVAVGHIGFLNELFLEVLGNAERAEELLRFLYEKNYVGYASHVKNLALSSIDKKRLLDLLQLRGSEEILEEAKQIAAAGGQKAVADLQELFSILEMYGVKDKVFLDFTLFSHMSYYTGIVFEGYTKELGFPLCSGGRYDQLLDEFGRSAQAIGFGIRLDYLIEALDVKEPVNPRTCIVFSPERRKEAIVKSRELREKGKSAVVQDISGVGNVDEYSGRFEEVIYYIGKPVKGEVK